MTQASPSSAPNPTQQLATPRQNLLEPEMLLAAGRFLLFGFILVFFALLGGLLFENIDPIAMADQIQATNPFFANTPDWLLELLVTIFNPRSMVYMLPPLAAFICVFLAAGRYIEDVYALPNLRLALRYELSSIFGLGYPRVNIANGRMEIPEGTTNLLSAIGGPGFAIIQPGNVALFRHLRRPTSAPSTSAYFMNPFESIEQIANLDDQRETIAELDAVTRDGILMVVRNVQFRFRILPQRAPQGPLTRTINNPYPYSNAAVFSMAYNLTVEETGNSNWHQAVRRVVSGGITDFINSNTIDDLTAPRTNRLDPRAQIQRELVSDRMSRRLENIGAELLWIDVGHMDIVNDIVDDQRLHFWQAHWIGRAETIRAFGNAKRQTYLEQGRAEAQAEMIMSILATLENRPAEAISDDEIIRLVLARTSQILESIAETHPPKNSTPRSAGEDRI